MPTPPASSETVTYGWSNIGKPRYFHKAIPRGTQYGSIHDNRAKCDRGSWLDQQTAERHSVPAHLKPCPRCFGKAVQ